MTTIRNVMVLGLLVGLMMSLDVYAQSADADLRQEIESLKAGQKAIQKELQNIKQLLQTQRRARPQAPNVRDVVFDLGDNPFKGSAAAPLALVEFTDYQ